MRSKLTTAVLALALGGALATTGATAGPSGETLDGIDYRYSSADVGPPPRATGRVTCQGRKSISGAGIFNVGLTAGNWHASTPIDTRRDRDRRPDDGWSFSVSRGDVGGPGSARFTGICHTPRVYRSKSFAVGKRQVNDLVVRCPAGKFAVSGGAVMAGRPYGFILGTSDFYDSGDAGQAPDDGWTVSGKSTVKGHKVKVTVVCWSKKPAYQSDSVTVVPGDRGDTFVACSGFGHVLGLGATLDVTYAKGGRFGWFLRAADTFDDSDGVPDDRGEGQASLTAGAPAAADYTTTVACTPGLL